MSALKITVIGGGSSYTPELLEGFITRHSELPVGEICLVDIPAGGEKLAIITGLAGRMMSRAGKDIKITATFDRREALRHTDFVVTQFRVGGLAARATDERFPLRHGVLGQETVGAGGFAKAIRTIPVILDICRDIEELCPEAWLINFTNPAGLITETVLSRTNVKCIGLCNVAIHMRMTIAKLLAGDPGDVYIDFVGLNHLLWGRKVWHKGLDVTGRVLDKLHDSAALTMQNIPDLKWDGDFLRSLGMVPSPYLRYYYMTDSILAEERHAASAQGAGTRAEIVQAVEEKLFAMYSDPTVAVKPAELEKRGGAYYSEAAVSLISAIYNDKREIHTVNTFNQGAISSLPDHAVIEANCVVGKQGAVPLTIGTLPWEIAGLVHQVKAYEALAIEAGVRGSADRALQALVANPLISSVAVAKEVWADLVSLNAPYLPQFKSHVRRD